MQTIHEAERLLIPVIDEHDGILLKVEGEQAVKFPEVTFEKLDYVPPGATSAFRVKYDL